MNSNAKKQSDRTSVDGRTTRFAAHRVRRRDELLEKTTVLLAEHGLRALTIDDIAGSLNIPKPVLYRYFSSKEELIKSALTRARENLVEADVEGDESDWRQHLLGAVTFIAQHPETFIVLYRHAANDMEYRSYFEGYFDQICEITKGRLSRFSDVGTSDTRSFDFFARTLVSFLFNSTLTWVEDQVIETEAFHKWIVRSTVALTEIWAALPSQSGDNHNGVRLSPNSK